jgi:hypothetical protein
VLGSSGGGGILSTRGLVVVAADDDVMLSVAAAADLSFAAVLSHSEHVFEWLASVSRSYPATPS